MLTEIFYDILDGEIDAIIDRYKDYPVIAKYKDKNQKKSYAFLIWFLEFYGRLSQFKRYITNGSEDASCDIIFSRSGSEGANFFYIVQAKWCTRKNALGKISSKEVRNVLNDFETILRGDKGETRNEQFNIKYRALLEHLEKNGKAKFIILALAGDSDEYKDNLDSFNKHNGPNNSVEVLDIERIKRDYIDLNYKGIKKLTPLDIEVLAENSKITIPIERFGGVPGKGDIIKKADFFKAYVVSVKPGTVHRLFKDYGFSLFAKNIRNPLPESNYNAQIADTLKNGAEHFWYFNNGITAISRIIPEIGNEAKEIQVTGLQVINGAQTVYSVYSEYENASPSGREAMDKNALIMLRLVNSGNKDFNFKVTRYTNSQNPMIDRDFHANDPVQARLQEESFNTHYWYETRRGEFQEVPKGIQVVENLTFAACYLSFFLEALHDTVINNRFIFVSEKINRDEGLYEKVFSADTTFGDMLVSYLVVEQIMGLILPGRTDREEGKTAFRDFHDEGFLPALIIAPLFKAILKEYLDLKLNKPGQISLTHYILKNRIAGNIFENILKYALYSLNLLDREGEVRFDLLTGTEGIRSTVDMVHRRINEKLSIAIDVRRRGVEFFDAKSFDDLLSSLATA